MERKRTSTKTKSIAKSKTKLPAKTKAFMWTVKHKGKTSIVSANTMIGAQKQAMKNWKLKGELRQIEATILR